ncbi:unnamed protein product [Caenorhabditis angaria]|uniref:BTB domain-containing protein n=1 Tax=Caenorhabditis angaria TaxID=860376 RepID=A0A9P1I757_9PELO|nr:unnamed protein product [Caenorhabditis angaria]
MVPIVRNGNKITWKFENTLDFSGNGKYSSQYLMDGLRWYINAKEKTISGLKYLEVSLINWDRKSNQFAEFSSKFRIIDENDKELYNSTFSSFPASVKLSDFTSDVSKLGRFTFECEFNYKFYNFAKSSDNFNYSDGIFKIGKVEFHVNKGYFSAFSKIFFEKFYKNNEKTIDICDVEDEDFVQLLSAIVPDPVKINSENYSILYDLSEKFEIDSLTKKCQKYFKHNQCAEIIGKIKNAEQNQEPIFLLDDVKRAKELKILMESEDYKNFKESTKATFASAAFKFL